MNIMCHGLGAMGLPIASRLARHGHRVQGADPSASAMTRWTDSMARGRHPAGAGSSQASASDARTSDRQQTQIVILCVSDERAARAVIDQHLHEWPAGLIVIDHTTTSAAFAREAHRRLGQVGITYCDAPLSGGVESAQGGQLVAMLGADPAAADTVRSILAPYTREVLHMGPAGTGQVCKMANQIAIAGIAAGLEAARQWAIAQGLVLPQVFSALSLGSADSVQLERLRAALSDPATPARSLFAWLGKDFELYEAAETIEAPGAQALISLYRQHVAPTKGAIGP